MKQRKLNDIAVSKTLPVIPDASPSDPGKAVFTFTFVVFAIVDVAFGVIVSFIDDVVGDGAVDEHAPVISKKKNSYLHYVLRNAKKSRYFINENIPLYFTKRKVYFVGFLQL